jgi:hypothetical protein
MAGTSFQEKLAKMKVIEWTPEPAPTAEESLRDDRVYGVTSMAQLDAVILARRAKAEAAKKGAKD